MEGMGEITSWQFCQDHAWHLSNAASHLSPISLLEGQTNATSMIWSCNCYRTTPCGSWGSLLPGIEPKFCICLIIEPHPQSCKQDFFGGKEPVTVWHACQNSFLDSSKTDRRGLKHSSKYLPCKHKATSSIPSGIRMY